ncbi:GAF domain-containing sensor histidine kinase [Flagellimonas sp. S3867]|uniref:GAF domain-containing sensor histidine kinase n=1 Tax=Flagellimonas sp. S3867 TaxID=2768063 RepID=UPI001686F846|nr:GAF domain-containing sensor histidine kinase [Flagellimonas sp. S3867]
MSELDFKKRNVHKTPLKDIAKEKLKKAIIQMNTENMLEAENGVLDAVDNGIVIADANLDSFPIIYANKAFERITGYKLKEVLGRNCNFLQSDDRHQKEIETIRRSLVAGKSCNVTLRNYKKNGSMFWNELTITPIKNKKGELTHFIGFQNDITQKKKLELLRKAKSDILEMVVKKSALTQIVQAIQQTLEQQIPGAIVAIMIADRKKRILSEINAPRLSKGLITTILKSVPIKPDFCCCATAAYSKKRVIQQNIEEELTWQKYIDVVKESELKSCWSYPILDVNDGILGVLTVFHQNSKSPAKTDEELIWEMTNLFSLAIEQMRMREQLEANLVELSSYSKGLEKKVKKRTKDLNKAVLDLEVTNIELVGQTNEAKAAELRAETNEAILMAIIKKFPKGAILLVDDQMQIQFMEGTELKDVQQQVSISQKIKIDELEGFSSQRKELFINHVQRTLNGEHLSFETEYRRIPYAINTTPLSIYNGNITHALFVLLNITDRKQIEGKMLQNLDREKELSDLKSRFISTASHEFRTPLSVILSSSTLIEKQNQPGMEDRRLKHLNRIKSNVQHLVTVLNDFLSLSKLEEGKTIARPEWFNLVDFSKSMLDQMVLSKKEGQIIAFEHDTAKVPVHLDSKLMRHILLNLLGNAIKYSEEGQKILLKIQENGQQVSIEVTDEGIGIPLNEQQHLFQRFFRAKNSLNIAGTGLGLHIVKQYVELMKGTLNFESMKNKGSTFTVTFPKNTQENEKSTSN